ncbi:hypothetical protein NNO07_06030 [Pseudomonas resinovorans]|uniref:TspB protein n=1 Tax=Metapseudomonas resinovorans TaxID=53412 RepID=A0ABT4Y1G5_METRE|nr:virulence factor TspB C-terminal domain-related protein [Pseudomonas resinovorans]MDA8482621.1 hypothetical protein [Pseudomonas resinovorans]
MVSTDTRWNPPAEGISWVRIGRYGDSCPTGTEYNPVTGVCEGPQPDPCESSIGQSLSHEHRMGEYTGGGAIGGRTDPPGVVCQGSCQYAWDSAGPTNVYRFVDGTPNGVFGLFAYKGNGVSCSEEDSPSKGPSSLEAQSKSESSCTDKVTDGEGRVLMTCQTSVEYTNPGSCDRGQVDVGSGLQDVCIPKSPSPSQQKTETEKDITEVTNPDGSKTTTTSETTTTTNCSGTKACTTSVTNNTSVSHTNADGTKGSESSTCTGPGCKDSDGKSQEDKAKEEEEQEEGESSASGLQCEQAIACEGDAIQCAILQQEKEQKCAAEELNDFAGHKGEIEGFLAEADPGNPESPQVQVPSFIQSGARWLPSNSCPADKTVNLRSGGGKTLAFSYEPLCAAASDLSYVFVALAGIAAALYVGRAFGGA